MALVVLSGKVLPETKEQFKEAFENSEAMTHNEFVELLLETFLNPKTKEVEVPTPTADQMEAIQLKDNEIGRLKMQIDSLNKVSQEWKDKADALETEGLALKTQVEAKPTGLKIADNQALLTFPPVVSLVLDKEAEIAKRQTGKEFSKQEILLNSFWDSITKGAAYPLKVWSANDLKNLKKQLQPEK